MIQLGLIYKKGLLKTCCTPQIHRQEVDATRTVRVHVWSRIRAVYRRSRKHQRAVITLQATAFACRGFILHQFAHRYVSRPWRCVDLSMTSIALISWWNPIVLPVDGTSFSRDKHDTCMSNVATNFDQFTGMLAWYRQKEWLVAFGMRNRVATEIKCSF